MLAIMFKELSGSDVIRTKVKDQNEYALALYRALCYNRFCKESEPRYLGSRKDSSALVDRLLEGSYRDGLCLSGSEGVLTDEIIRDLYTEVGWELHVEDFEWKED